MMILLSILGCSFFQPSPPPCGAAIHSLIEESRDTAEMARRVRREPRMQACMRQELSTTRGRSHEDTQIRIIHLYNLTPELMDDETVERMILLAKSERLRELMKGKRLDSVQTPVARAVAQAFYHFDKENLARLIRTLGLHEPQTYLELVEQCEKTPYLYPEIYACVLIQMDGISRQSHPLNSEESNRHDAKIDAFMEEYLPKAVNAHNARIARQKIQDDSPKKTKK